MQFVKPYKLTDKALELQGHDFKVQYCKDALNYVPDALSKIFEHDSCLAISAVKDLPETHDGWYIDWFEKVSNRPNDFPR